MIEIRPADPRDAQIAALLEQSHALMERLFPPEENHFLDISELTEPDIAFFAAFDDAGPAGTVALADRGEYAEIKSMFVAPRARGLGIGRALLTHAEAQARQRGFPALTLETGNALREAISLYRKAGFERCEPFGDYEANATSVFMRKELR